MLIDRLHHFVLSELRRLMGATEGVVALIVALSILPVVTLAGAAVDLRRVSAARTNLQTTADAAALAGADALRQGGNVAAARAAAAAFVNASIVEGASMRPTLASLPEVSGTSVNVKLNMSVPTTLMKIARINEVSVKAEATAAYGAGGGGDSIDGAEIALAIDTTESMARDGRLDAAKTAAKLLIDKVTLRPNGTVDTTVRAGLVPFAKYVNIGTRYHTEPWLLGPGWLRDSLSGVEYYNKTKNCSIGTRRITKTCYLHDIDPYDCSYNEDYVYNCEPDGQLSRNMSWFGCVGSWSDDDERAGFRTVRPIILEDGSDQYDRRCPEPLVRLSRDPDRVKQAIDRLTPEGETYIAPGLLWAWRVVSPEVPFAGGSAVQGVAKSIVLMTDGANTNSPDWPYGTVRHESTDVAFANAKFATICTNAKAAGVKIYTVAFMLTDDAIKQRLKACASTPANYYDAPSNAELERAYADIGTKMTALRLIK